MEQRGTEPLAARGCDGWAGGWEDTCGEGWGRGGERSADDRWTDEEGVWIWMWIYLQVGRQRVSLMRDRLGEMDGWDIYSDG